MERRYDAFLFDIDGVIIRPTIYYSSFLEKNGYPGAFESIECFYKQDLPCIIGKKDPLIDVESFLSKFGWEHGAEKYFSEQYKYESSFIDNMLLEKIKMIRSIGTKCYLATDQNHHRKNYILNEWKFRSYFDGYYVSADIGYRKIDNEFWIYIANDLGRLGICKKQNVLFIDDRIENINKAKEHGFDVFHVERDIGISRLYELIENGLTIASTMTTRPVTQSAVRILEADCAPGSGCR